MFFVHLFLIFASANAANVYFTMTDIRMTIPTDRGKFPPSPASNRSLLQLFTSHHSTPGFSIINGSDKNFLTIDSSTGNVFFVDNQPPRNVSHMSVTVQADQARTLLTLDFLALDEIFDCDYIVEDLCFWKSVHYHINENSEAGAVLGSLASPYLPQLCPGTTINYTILNSTKAANFHLIRSGHAVLLKTARAFDRESGSELCVEVLCTVGDPQKTLRNVTKTLSVGIIDVDDNPARAQEDVINIFLSSNVIQKGQNVSHPELIFHDKDSSSVNKYQPIILHDKLKILQPLCRQTDISTIPPKTAIICTLKFNETVHRTNWTYAIILQLNDTTLVDTKPDTKMASLPIYIHFPSATGQHAAMMKRQEPLKQPSIYPSTRVKVFRTAAPFARITQPNKGTNAVNFTIQIAGSKRKSVFNVTSVGGIVYVNPNNRLQQAPEFVRLNISCKVGKRKIIDELEIHIVDEPTKTCEHMGSKPEKWKACSTQATRRSCLNSTLCAISTGGASSVAKREQPNRCMWRGEPNQSNEVSQLYSTCTPDTDTCPDGICDPLEELNDRICPQDCTHHVLWPTSKNPSTNRGIAKASGVCTCNNLNCQCDPPSPEPEVEEPPQLQNHPNVSKHVDKSHGIDMAHCGTTCVLGIVAGSVFLGGALALVVICWRLVRVHKAVRGKFGEESQDLSAPLSDYIDRSNPLAASAPDPLPLTFDMTTSLVDTTIISIINKYAPDSKWEFPRNQLTIEQTLGEGEFGRVLRAKALNIAGQSGLTTVAVKTLKEDAREAELNDLLSEYQLLKEVSHPNVIRLLGVCTAPGGPIYLIIEFAEHGSLRNYLRRSRHLKSECGRLPTSTGLDDTEIHYDEPNVAKITPKEILSFAWQISKGMSYLSEIKLVHRDLAARNVLLAADKICKISDFGLTRDIYEDDAYFKRSKGRVPVKWMAPESLSDHIYTNKSDVWSFGILVWELVTLGATPYPGIAVQNIFHLLRQGYRMERPENCSPALYNIMQSCWHIEPEKRPTFQQLAAMWEKMLGDQVEYLDLTNNAIHNRSYFYSPLNNNSTELEMDEKTASNPLNYLCKSQSYVKCAAADKFPNVPENQLLYDNSNNELVTDNNQNTPQAGYETPVKVPQVLQTPTNDCPQYYTDMAAGKNT